ncbi:g10962 [Coccomyxa viridis]|uniref:G10962 protein n=1 Tax=Coccomyxa viridis TaxID=1274662 RepID=A0ABP1G7Y5_9CHLO
MPGAPSKVTLDSQKQEEPFQVSLDLGSLAPAAQSTEGLPKGRLRALLPACRRVLPSCNRRQRRACLAVGACLGLLALCGLAFSAPWWWPWLLWRDSTTSFASIGPGYDPVTYRPTNASAMGPHLIPAVVHQTWKTTEVPEQWQAARQSCIDMHPSFHFRLWTDEDARALIARDLPELLPTFDSYPFNIQRADAIRYVLLYKFGGFYMDLDIECHKPMDALRAYPFIMPQTRPVGFSNDFFASTPGHPFVRKLLDALPSWNMWLFSKYPTVMFTTGPMFVTLQASLYSARKTLWVLPDELYGKYVPRPESLFGHLWGSSWHGEDAKGALWVVHHPRAILGALLLAAFVMGFYIRRRRPAVPGALGSSGPGELQGKMC